MGASVTAPMAARIIGERLRRAGDTRSQVVWPSAQFRGRHLELARDLLGYRVLSRLQKSIIDAYYAHDRAKIAACTGQKCGKTEVEIVCILVDFATEKNLNYFLFAPKIDHTNEVLWPRLIKVALEAYYPCADCMPSHRAWCALVEADPLDETPRPDRCDKCSPLIPSKWKNPKDKTEGRVSEWLDPKNSEGGLRAPDGRVVRGYAARKLGAKGGLSGVVRIGSDESSDIDDETEDSWDGNLMGGGKRLSFGNLLYGYNRWFGKAFGANKSSYTAVFQQSSRMSPNCKGRIVWSDGVVTENYTDEPPIKGIADVTGIEAYLDGGRRSKNLIAARVDAQAPSVIEGQLVGLEHMTRAEQRWSKIEPDGILQFGVDPARYDKFAIAVRRGNSIRELTAEVLGGDDYARGVDLLMEARARYIKPHERKPRLVYDASGKEGKRFREELNARNAGELFDLYPIFSTFRPSEWKLYDKKRDELACYFADWLRGAGSIPTDTELQAEIEATTAERVEVSYGATGQRWVVQRVITNDELRHRNRLGRSPDKRNACELAVWSVDGVNETEADARPEVTEEEVLAALIVDKGESRPEIGAAVVPARQEPCEHASTLSVHERLAAVYRTQWGHR